MVGLSLGVMALIVVVSVMNGFDSQLKHRILGAVPHMVVKGRVDIDALEHPGILQHAAFIQREGILMHRGRNQMVAIYGVDPELEQQMSVIPEHMLQGSVLDLIPGEHKVLLGAPLARQLGLWPGDALSLLIPEPSKQGATVVPKFAKLIMAGTFELRSEVDYGLIIMHVTDLQTLLAIAEPDTRLKLSDVFLSPKIASLLIAAAESAGQSIQVDEWTARWGDFFETVRLEKIMMFILLTLIVAIAAFNTVSGLSMMVKEKQGEIATLRTMGLSSTGVMSIFVVQGTLIGLVGTVIGLVFGLPLAYHVTEVVGFFEDLMGNRMLAGTYFERVPTDVRLEDILMIVAVSMLISILATLYPAYRAAKVNPAEVLKAE